MCWIHIINNQLIIKSHNGDVLTYNQKLDINVAITLAKRIIRSNYNINPIYWTNNNPLQDIVDKLSSAHKIEHNVTYKKVDMLAIKNYCNKNKLKFHFRKAHFRQIKSGIVGVCGTFVNKNKVYVSKEIQNELNGLLAAYNTTIAQDSNVMLHTSSSIIGDSELRSKISKFNDIEMELNYV